MKKFVLKISLFLVILWMLVSGFQYVIDKGLQKSTVGEYKEWNDIIKARINADLIVQGSSRACFHVSPYVLDSVLQLNTYNLGLNGWAFQMQYYRLLLYLKHNKKPKYLIQNVDHSTLNKNTELFGHNQFLPYLASDIIQTAVAPYMGVDWKDIYIPMYKYRSNDSLVLLGLQEYLGKSGGNNGKYKGFLAKDKLWETSFRQHQAANPSGIRTVVNPENRLLFEQYLKLCKAQNIQVIFVYTPEYIEAQRLIINRDSINTIFKNYASSYKIPFLDYSKDAICLDTVNFYNSQHLNKIGTQKFNTKLAQDLKAYMK